MAANNVQKKIDIKSDEPIAFGFQKKQKSFDNVREKIYQNYKYTIQDKILKLPP